MAFDLASYAAECGVAEPERFVERCNLFRDYLLETNRTLNLTRITGVEEFAVKHVADSLAIARYFPEFREARLRVADIGCGAGFPSLVLALAFYLDTRRAFAYKNKPAEICLAGEKHRWAVYYALVVALLVGYIMQSGGFGNSGFGMYAGF